MWLVKKFIWKLGVFKMKWTINHEKNEVIDFLENFVLKKFQCIFIFKLFIWFWLLKKLTWAHEGKGCASTNKFASR
jgi:hypothetical protein